MSERLRVVFMGTPEFSVPALKTLIENTDVLAVYTQPDKPVGRGLQVQPSPVKKIALEHSLPVYTPEKVSIPEEIARIQALKADFIVVVAYGQILKLPVIEASKHGCINIHSSLLPRWRGAAPIHRALLAGDKVTGVTTMMIVPKLDAGDMLMQESTPISAHDTAASLHDRLSEIGGRLILQTLIGVKEGSIRPIPQDESQVTYAHKLGKEMENLDWSKTAEEVDLNVRALNPWPGVKIVTSTGLKLKIKAGVPHRGHQIDQPGLLVNDRGHLFLTCGRGSFEITELQEEGKKAIKSHDFMNGLKGRNLALPIDLQPLYLGAKEETTA